MLVSILQCMCWRANKPIVAAQIEKMWKDGEELGLPRGIILTIGHCPWFLDSGTLVLVDFSMGSCWCATD